MAKRNSKQTSRKVVRKASRILRDGRYSKNSKSVQAALYRKPSLSASNLPGGAETALNWTACIAKVVIHPKII